MMDAIPPQPGTIVGDHYRVDRVVGAGGMSIVVAATHLEIERPVAIKFLNPATAGKDAVERFRREAQNAARLKNEHVVRVIDIGALPGGLPFIVMDLVEGSSLREELLARGPFSVSDAVAVLLQATEAIAEAHSLGIVHRDLKPANLFLAECADRTRIVKVLDFGVSKALTAPHGEMPVGLTRTGMIIGSPLYMPPEQLQSPRSVDHRADIWALGAVLYELITGRVPYAARSYPELCTLVLSEPPPVSRHGREVPAEFEAVLRRCLASDREARFQSVSELRAALLPFATGPVPEWSAPRPNTFEGLTDTVQEPRSAPARKGRNYVVLGVTVGGLASAGFWFLPGLSSESGANRVERGTDSMAMTTNGATPASVRSAPARVSAAVPSVTPLGTALAEAATSGVAASAARAVSGAPEVASTNQAASAVVSAPLRTNPTAYARRSPAPPAAPVASVPRPAESALTDFGGRR